MSELHTGTLVERYLVEAPIGKGGMAVVYRVRHQSLGTTHAMKVLTIPSQSVRQRLIQEGRVQAALAHPNIVAVTDVVDVAGSPGLVMELIRGPSLERLLQDHRLSFDECDVLVKGILDGVGHAHQRGLIHRDLKPANILLALQGGLLVPKITDFGLAKVLSADLSATQTRSGTTMGTPAYMAPEQIRNARSVDHRADVFSVGAILYEMVTGRRAFDGEDLLALFTQIAHGTYQPPGELTPGLPDRMARAIQGALEPDRDKRIADCATLWEIWRGDRVTGPAPSGPWSPLLLSRYSEATDGRGFLAPKPPEGRAETWADPQSAQLSADSIELPSVLPPTPVPPARVQARRGSFGPVLGALAGVALIIGVGAAGTLAGGGAMWAATGLFSEPAPAEPEPAPAPSAVPAPFDLRLDPDETEARPVPAPRPGPAPDPKPPPAPAAGPKPRPAPLPAPTPTAQPVPEPEPEPEPRSAERPIPAGQARVAVGGTSEGVWLVNATGNFPVPADVPAGTYTVHLFIDGQDVELPKKTLEEGRHHKLQCSPRLRKCDLL